jgi:ABC-2 type transport system permease protein
VNIVSEHKTASKHKAGFVAALKRELKDYRLRSGDLILSVTILLTSMAAVAWIFSSGTLTNLPIAVIDNDNSSVSRIYIRLLEATPEMRIVNHLSSPLQGRELLEQASIYALVLIPEDFGNSLKTGRQATVVAWHSQQFLTISGVLSKSLRKVSATISAKVEMTSLKKRGDTSLAANVKYEPVKSELRTLFNPFQNYQYFLVSGLWPAMLQIFVMVWTVFAVGREFRDNTSAEWLAAGSTVYAAVAAKVLPVFTIACVIGLGCLAWLYGVVGWSVNGSLGMLIVGWALTIGAHIVLGLLAAGFAPLLGTSLSFAVFLTAPAYAYAGITFPQHAMPVLAQLWSYALPVRSLLRLQIEQVDIGAPISSSVPELLILAAFILFPLPFTIRRIRIRCEASRIST